MSKRNIIEISGTATAIEPIHQGGDRSGGTVSEIRRELTIVNGVPEYMPVISANSIAGILRDQCAFWSLDQIGFERFGKDAMRAFDLLTSGGGRVVKATDSKYIDLFEEGELRSMFPVISLFGGSIGNRMMTGRISVSNWVPVCDEMKARLPKELHQVAENYHVEDLLQELQFTTRDDKKQRAWQDYIEPNTLHEWQAGNEKADKANEAKTAPISMRYGMEALAAGTMFSVGFKLHNPSEIDLGCFFGGLSYFAENPKIGGRGNRGFGQVELDLRQYKLTGFTKVDGPLAIESMDAAREHLISKKSSIEQALAGGAI